MGLEENHYNEWEYEEILTQDKLTELKNDFSRLGTSCHHLDHAGATLYSKSQIESAMSELQNNIFSNPHSRSPSSSITTDAVDNVRQQILHHFSTNSEEYSVIFTANATAGMKLVAESFSFNNGGFFAYLEESHTSVIGMREYLLNKNDSHSTVCCSSSPSTPDTKNEGVYCISKSAMESLMKKTSKEKNPQSHSETKVDHESNALIAIPAQCNFSGYKFPFQEWTEKIHNGYLDGIESTEKFYIDGVFDKTNNAPPHNYYVLLDAASYVASNPLNLTHSKPDFVAISFYKMFGWPTGLGALLIRNNSASVLNNKKYFGGGTVNISLPSEPFHVKRGKLEDKFEDGTISFLSILGVRHGLKSLQTYFPDGMVGIKRRTFRLIQYFYKNLSKLKYANGCPVAKIYADTEYGSEEYQGPVLTFNLLRPNGDFVGYSEMEQIAYLHNVNLRYGCFCNPGACRRHLGLTAADVLKHYEAGHVCGDMHDLINGTPTGAIRVSVGYMTLKENIDFLLELIKSSWVEPFNATYQSLESFQSLNNNTYAPRISRPKKLSRIFLYPIKSCGPFEVKSSSAWTLGPQGLLFDREWLIVTSAGVPLTAKREPRLNLIQPLIDVTNGRRLILRFNGCDETVSVPLDHVNASSSLIGTNLCNSKVCGDMITGMDCGDEVSNWLSVTLGVSGLRLVRKSPNHQRKSRNSSPFGAEVSLANQSQYLLLSMTSLRALAKELISNKLLSSLNIHQHFDEVEKKTEESINNSQNQQSFHSDHGQDEQSFEEQIVKNLIGRFRSNLIIDDGHDAVPFEEENWEGIRIGAALFASGGPCARCATICMDPLTGHKSSEPLLTLSRSRGGRPAFGIHLYSRKENESKILQTIRIGDICEVVEGKKLTPFEILQNID